MVKQHSIPIIPKIFVFVFFLSFLFLIVFFLSMNAVDAERLARRERRRQKLASMAESGEPGLLTTERNNNVDTKMPSQHQQEAEEPADGPSSKVWVLPRRDLYADVGNLSICLWFALLSVLFLSVWSVLQGGQTGSSFSFDHGDDDDDDAMGIKFI